MHHLRGVLLDEQSFNPGDLNLTALLANLLQWDRYPASSAEEVLERVKNAHVLVLNKAKITQDVIDQAPKLGLILLTATGSDNVDLAACSRANIQVCNVQDYCTPSLSQHVFALILGLSTSLQQYSTDTRSGQWSDSTHFSLLHHPIIELSGKKIGLVGYGNLAKGVERLAHAFDMQVLIAARPNTAPSEGRFGFDEVIQSADVVSLHCPLTPDTKHLINAQRLQQMKSSAFLINTARGGIVDNAALANALKLGEIAGAGIDVLEQEPPPVNHPLLAKDVPNLLLTPHTAWASREARQRLVGQVAENLQQWINQTPTNVLNPNV